jgi:Kef-type K+ transport system membrane component KefB
MSPVLASLIPHPHLPVLVIIGAALLFGSVGGRLFQKLRIPQVVGYIVIGLVVGESCLGIVDAETLEKFDPFNFFALGIIGFMIGGELHRDVFRKYGKQFFSILCAEGFGAFAVVALLSGGLVFLLTGNLAMGIAVGIVLGGISSATAPAATVEVLREYKTRGVLTTAIYAIVAMDDGLALALFAVTASIAGQLMATGDGGTSLLTALAHAGYELFGAVAMGAVAGIALNMILYHANEHSKALTYTVGSLAVVIGVGVLIKVDVIMAAMTLGVTIVNLAPRRSRFTFEIVERFAPPIYVLFFVLVGSHLKMGNLGNVLILGIAVAYVVGRSGGKLLGSWLGAKWTKSPRVLQTYLGMCLFSQGGVAIGLALVAGKKFAGVELVNGVEVGPAIAMIVTLTTFIVELLGPVCVKVAVHKAGEVGLNITEEDLMSSYKVSDLMDESPSRFPAEAPMQMILRTIADTDAMSYPVVDDTQRLVGVISLADLKQGFSTEGLTAWLVAFDLMRPAEDTVSQDEPLAEAVHRMRQQDLECLPVIASPEDERLVGMLELRAVGRKLSQEILRRRQLAESGAE